MFRAGQVCYMDTSLSKCVPDTFGKSTYSWEVSAKRQQLSCPLSSCKDWGTGVFAFCCLTQHAGVQPASVLLSLQELKTSLELLPSPLKDTANQLPYSQHKTILAHTHFSFSHLCALSKGSRGDGQGRGTHQGLDRVDVVYSKGYSRRPLAEVQSGATRITKWNGLSAWNNQVS